MSTLGSVYRLFSSHCWNETNTASFALICCQFGFPIPAQQWHLRGKGIKLFSFQPFKHDEDMKWLGPSMKLDLHRLFLFHKKNLLFLTVLVIYRSITRYVRTVPSLILFLKIRTDLGERWLMGNCYKAQFQSRGDEFCEQVPVSFQKRS